jgi:nitroreductase
MSVAPGVLLQSIEAAVEQRHSVRAFRADPVSQEVVRQILDVARRAPSGTNTQPWKVYVLTGSKLQECVSLACTAFDAVAADPSKAAQYPESYDYYPTQWVSPFIDRRRENGWSLYGLLGITKTDKDKMLAQQRRNYTFFDAPVGLIFTVPRVMGRGSLVDYGMFLQNIMLLAKAHGLDTCPQAAWNTYEKILLPFLGASDDEMVVCGMALGYADSEAMVNTLKTPREPVESFTRFLS